MTDTNDLMLVGIPTPRAAGEVQISALPEATTPISENDITNIKQGVEDKKVTVKDLLAPHADKTGNVHGMTKADLDLGNVMNYPITDAVNDMDSNKYASAKAVALVTERLDKQTPIGHLLLSLNETNPAQSGYIGTWEVVGKGSALVGFDPNNQQRPLGSQYGSDTVTIGVNNMPAHSVRLTGVVSEAGSHEHTVNINTNGSGRHTHTVTGQVDAAGSHAHSVNLSTSQAGNHVHTFSATTSESGNHVHGGVAARTDAWTIGGQQWQNFNFRNYGTTDAAGNHAHSVSGSTSNAGNHTHSISGDTTAQPAHQHNVNLVTSQVDNHTHNVSGSTTNSGLHSHNIDLTSQSIGGSQPISVCQLSLVVYVWKRVA
jgi:hypothetical protein